MADMDAPPQVEVRVLGDYLEVMSSAVFQSGMSWARTCRRTRSGCAQRRAPRGADAYGTAWPAVTPVQRSLSTATLPFTRTKGMPAGN